MKKATQKTQPATLGTKRTCPKCGTKFYDFGKEQIHCPKCQAQFDAEELARMQRAPVEPKKTSKAPEKTDDTLMQADELATDDTETFESVDDLADDEDDVVEDIDVDEEDGEF